MIKTEEETYKISEKDIKIVKAYLEHRLLTAEAITFKILLKQLIIEINESLEEVKAKNKNEE